MAFWKKTKRSNVKDNRGVITGRIGIENRPDVVKQRSRIGDIDVIQYTPFTIHTDFYVLSFK